MTPDDPPTGRLRLQILLDVELKAWIEERMEPGSIFLSFGHAAELAWGWHEDERAFLKATCKAKRVPFDAKAVHRVHQAELEASRPPPVGRPAKGSTPGPARVRISMFISPAIIEAIQTEAEPRGSYSEASPVPHALETALRVLRAAERSGPMRAASFVFDGETLWNQYLESRKHAV